MTVRRMRVVREPAAARRTVRAWRARGDRIVFVPTMGYFHAGHLALMERGRRLGERVVVSLFVNPAQFAPDEDFATYPRDLKRDMKLVRDAGIDLLFLPTATSMYRPGHRTEIRVAGLEGVLEGKTRPTHFAGVALIVQKLLHIVEPDVLILGQKDAQQAVVLETMIRDLNIPVRVVRGATVREVDGLALSSRNVALRPAEREAAPVLYRALRLARGKASAGERSAESLLRLIRSEIAREPRVRLDYAAVVNARTLEPLERVEGRVLIPIAAYLGRTRLIDNVEFTAPPGERR